MGTLFLPEASVEKERNAELSINPTEAPSFSDILSLLYQDNIDELGVGEYSLSQISLEQIFNGFAAQQQEEQGRAAGMM